MDSGRRSALAGAIRNKLRAERANRLTEVIVLILIATVAVGVLICATLALVGLDCPNAYRLTWLGEGSMWITKITERYHQSDAVGSAVACAYVTVCATIRVRGKTVLSY
jgi:hypothetical protein